MLVFAIYAFLGMGGGGSELRNNQSPVYEWEKNLAKIMHLNSYFDCFV